jgi:hypothetical protein
MAARQQDPPILKGRGGRGVGGGTRHGLATLYPKVSFIIETQFCENMKNELLKIIIN